MLKQIKSRPLVFFVTAFIFGMLICSRLKYFSGFFVSYILLLLLAATAVLRFLKNERIRRLSILFPVALGILSGTLYQNFYVRIKQDAIKDLDGKSGTVIGVVEEITYTSDYFSTYIIDVVSLDGEERSFKTALEIPYDLFAAENDAIEIDVTFALPNEREYSYELRKYYASKGIFISAYGDEGGKVVGYDSSVFAFFKGLSSDLGAKLRFAMGSEEGGFLSGLILGRKCDIPDGITTSFRYLGISHVLAVSGLHLTVITAGLSALLLILTIPKKLRYIITILFIICFILLTGARPSVIRAGIMLSMIMIAELVRKDYDPLTALSLSAFIILILSPSSIYDAGFFLSVSATLGIILLGSPCVKLLFRFSEGRPFYIRLLLKLMSPLSVTAAAIIFTTPIVYLYFGQTSSVALITNLIFLPIITALVYLGIFALIFFKTPIAPAFFGMAGGLAKAVRLTADFFMKFMPEPIDLTYYFVPAVMIISAIIAVTLLVTGRRGLCVFLTVSVFTVSYYGFYLAYRAVHENEAVVVCVNSSDNDQILVNCNGNTLLCDFSTGSYSSINRASSLSSTLLHDFSVDTLLITHLHRMHINTLARLSDNNRLRQIFIPKPQNEEDELFSESIKEVARSRGIKVFEYSSDCDVTFGFEGCRITLYERVYIERSVQPIQLLKIVQKRTLLYASSAIAESSLYEAFLSELPNTDVLFLGSHGPKIKAALPEIASGITVYAANESVNEGYESDFEIIDFYKKFRLD